LSKKTLIATVVIAVVLGVATGALIIYGVVTHEETGLLRVCWGEDGKARYFDPLQLEGVDATDGESCDRPKKLVWPKEQVPLSVTAIAGDRTTMLVPGTTPRIAIDAAIEDLNRQFGFNLFAPSRDRAWSDIVVHLGIPVETKVSRERGKKGLAPLLGRVQHRRVSSNAIRCDLTLYANTGSYRHEYLVAHHELLHCAGFGHDEDNPSSAMYPLTTDGTMFGRMHAARVTDHDRELGRRLYMKASR